MLRAIVLGPQMLRGHDMPWATQSSSTMPVFTALAIDTGFAVDAASRRDIPRQLQSSVQVRPVADKRLQEQSTVSQVVSVVVVAHTTRSPIMFCIVSQGRRDAR